MKRSRDYASDLLNDIGGELSTEKRYADAVANFKSKNVFPGENVYSLISSMTGSCRIGDGLVQNEGQIIVEKSGILVFEVPDYFHVKPHKNVKRYIPAVEDKVIGVITERSGMGYLVNIGGPRKAILDAIAFDGATKRNKPNLTIGSLIYARIISYNKHVDPVLTCTMNHGPKKDWMTGESLFGEIKGGYAFKAPLLLCQRLTDPNCTVLTELGRIYPFEIAIGLNGQVWIDSENPESTILIANSILNSQHLPDYHISIMIKKLTESLK